MISKKVDKEEKADEMEKIILQSNDMLGFTWKSLKNIGIPKLYQYLYVLLYSGKVKFIVTSSF